MFAQVTIDRGDDAFELYKKIAPAYLEDISDLHKTEPYVYSQMIAGKEANRHGEAKNSWLTGTSAWNYVAITEYILGIRAHFDGLYIDPKLPKSLDSVKVTRHFRGTEFEIIIKHDQDQGIFVDGVKQTGKIVKHARPKMKVIVHIL